MSAYTQRELDIANKSYVNKDFESIYLELLEIAENISKRFSPTNANEADPFIVLLKLIASVADKINYNIDKNILERFILSCTQESSMRELTEMLGYRMKYYRSAETSVVFKYNFKDAPEELNTLVIPAYSIVSDGNNLQYITTEAAQISREEGISNQTAVIQGVLKELTVLGKNIIQLENIDAQKRLYLPEHMIAENGISIASAAHASVWQAWSASDNLNTEVYGSHVYKFGFDSVKNLPYIQFPEWISDVIGSGLVIKYIVTDGLAGNVQAKGLKQVLRSESNDEVKDEDIVVINSSAANSGKDPEGLSEAYAGCKKLIGTFDNLVTCRDYANKIYEALNIYGNPCVSNIQVGDRRNDINYGCEVLGACNSGVQTYSNIPQEVIVPGKRVDIDSWSQVTIDQNKKAYIDGKLLTPADYDTVYYIKDKDEYWQYKRVTDEFATLFHLSKDIFLKDAVSPYDLCLYPLSPILNTSSVAVNDSNGYNNSYKIISNDPQDSQIKYIQTKLDDYKTMSHTYKQLKDSDIAYIQNLYKLEATINTSRKVSILEQEEILYAINDALIAKYNPRSLKFGQEIAFDELLATIEQADSRIKSVSLQEPEQTPKIILMNNDVVDIYDEDGAACEKFKFIVAKNLLAGKIEVFKYDDEFNYNFYQKDARKIPNVAKITTECNIPTFTDTDEGREYTLNANEVVQFLAPNLTTKTTYPYGINYYLEFAESNPMTYIPKNAEYRLGPGDKLVFSYVNNSDEVVTHEYLGDNNSVHIIKPNFDFYSTASRASETPTKQGIPNTDYANPSYKFYTLTANQSVEYRTLESTYINKFVRCYWLTNPANNEIRWEEIKREDLYVTYTYILADNEYFFVADFGLTELKAFGPGTLLKLSTGSDSNKTQMRVDWRHNNYVSIEDIDENGLSALGDYFIAKNFDQSQSLEIFENELITLTSGDTIKVTSPEANLEIPNNVFDKIPTDISVEYKFRDSEDSSFTPLSDRSSLTAMEGIDAGWSVRAVLDLDIGPGKPQSLFGDQKITFMPGIYDPDSSKYVAYEDLISVPSTFTESKIVIDNSLTESDCPIMIQSSVPIAQSGGESVSLQYLDLDLAYKCPSILVFAHDAYTHLNTLATKFLVPMFLEAVNDEDIKQDPNLNNDYVANINLTINTPAVDFISISSDDYDDIIAGNDNYYNNTLYYDEDNDRYMRVKLKPKAAIDENRYNWEEVESAEPNHRIFMLYIEGLEGQTLEIQQRPAIWEWNESEHHSNRISEVSAEYSGKHLRAFNKTPEWDDSVTLTNGVNIIEIRDTISGRQSILCDQIVLYMQHSAASKELIKEEIGSVSCLISPLKNIYGLNDNLGLAQDDDITQYMREKFNKQFRDFFSCADLESYKQIDVSEDYPLSSAQAFYDTNNIANKWVMCKIDFPNSRIRISRNSKK